jgi:hypothetical protein
MNSDVQDILDSFDYDPDDDFTSLECTCGVPEGDCENDNCECWICHAYPYAD